MDEFRRTYEYQEERVGGLLLVYIAMLLTAEIFITLSLTIQCNGALSGIPVLGSVLIGLGAVSVLCIIFSAFSVFKTKKYSIKLSRIYLIARPFLLIACSIVIFFFDVNNMNTLDNLIVKFSSVGDIVLRVLVVPIAYVLAFSIGWYLYFTKSKKCKEISHPADISHPAST